MKLKMYIAIVTRGNQNITYGDYCETVKEVFTSIRRSKRFPIVQQCMIQNKRRYQIECTRHVSRITFIRYAKYRNIGKPKNLNVRMSK